METTIHRRRAEVTAEKSIPFRPHRGLAAPDLFLYTMLDRRTWETCRLTVQNPWARYTGTCPKHIVWMVKLTEMLSWKSLFIPSWLSTRWSTKSSVRSWNCCWTAATSSLRLLGRNVIMGMAIWSSENTALRETQSPPTWRVKCRSGLRHFPWNIYKSNPQWFIVGGTKALIRSSKVSTGIYVIQAVGA
jgi:hypothetical protein